MQPTFVPYDGLEGVLSIRLIGTPTGGVKQAILSSFGLTLGDAIHVKCTVIDNEKGEFNILWQEFPDF